MCRSSTMTRSTSRICSVVNAGSLRRLTLCMIPPLPRRPRARAHGGHWVTVSGWCGQETVVDPCHGLSREGQPRLLHHGLVLPGVVHADAHHPPLGGGATTTTPMTTSPPSTAPARGLKHDSCVQNPGPKALGAAAQDEARVA